MKADDKIERILSVLFVLSMAALFGYLTYAAFIK